MLENSCLRPTCSWDIAKFMEQRPDESFDEYWSRLIAVEEMYNAEWKLRGFERSP